MNNFIYTPIRTLIVCSNFCRGNEPEVPYGVSCLVSAFKGNPQNVGDVVDVFTCDLNRFCNQQTGDYSIDWELIADEIVTKVRIGQYNVVAFSVFGWFETPVKFASHRLAQMQNPPFIMMGGASILGTEAELRAKFPYANMYTLSFGEKIFANLRQHICNGSTRVLDLPNFGELESPYLDGTIAIGKNVNTVRAETRRGCPFRCTFCKHRDTLSGKVHHVGCYERQVKEIELFKANGIKKLNVIDPLFNDYEGHGTKYLKLLRKMDFDGMVSLQIRPELLTDSFLAEAAKNHKLVFEIGVQSLQSDVLKVIQRGGVRTKVQLLDKLDKCRDMGIATEVTLIYGLPLQTYDSFARDVDLIKRYGVSKIGAFPLQVYPGTKLHSDIKQYDLTIKDDSFGIAEVIDNPSHDFDRMRLLASSIN